MTFFPELVFHQSGYNLRGRPRGRNDRLVESNSLDALTCGTSVPPSEAEPKVCIFFFSSGCCKGGRLLPRSDIAARHRRRGAEHKRGVPMNTPPLLLASLSFLCCFGATVISPRDVSWYLPRCHQCKGCLTVCTVVSPVVLDWLGQHDGRQTRRRYGTLFASPSTAASANALIRLDEM